MAILHYKLAMHQLVQVDQLLFKVVLVLKVVVSQYRPLQVQWILDRLHLEVEKQLLEAVDRCLLRQAVLL